MQGNHMSALKPQSGMVIKDVFTMVLHFFLSLLQDFLNFISEKLAQLADHMEWHRSNAVVEDFSELGAKTGTFLAPILLFYLNAVKNGQVSF